MDFAHLPRPGDILSDKYRIEEMLGAGGMGAVFAAHHQKLRQRVAIKFLLPEASQAPGAAERFLREAQAVAAIRNEHVARVLDVGTMDNGTTYIVMEHLQGADLSRHLRDRGPLPITDVIDYILQAGEAIAEAHSLGIIHRDLKSSNLFLTTRAEGSPLVKVLDFGLSKFTAEGDAKDESLTTTNYVAGSAQYMSPEQLLSLKNLDRRTDIWALGVIMYELFTGERPFTGPNAVAIFASIAALAPKPMRAHVPSLPETLDAVVLKCLEKDRDHRFQTMGQLAKALQPFAPASSRPTIERIVRYDARSSAPAQVHASAADHVAALADTEVARASLAPTVDKSDAGGHESLSIPMQRPHRLLLGMVFLGIGVAFAALLVSSKFARSPNTPAASQVVSNLPISSKEVGAVSSSQPIATASSVGQLSSAPKEVGTFSAGTTASVGQPSSSPKGVGVFSSAPSPAPTPKTKAELLDRSD